MKHWLYLVLVAALPLLAVGCSSKKKVTDGDHAMSVSDHDSTNENFNFDGQGSDSQKIPGLYTIHFAFDKASLSSEAKSDLQKNADWMNQHKGAKLKIEGHCDIKGSTEYNLALGEQRAKAAKTYLVNLGVSEDRLDTVSYGKEKTLTNEDSEAAQAKNRRDNFVPMP